MDATPTDPDLKFTERGGGAWARAKGEGYSPSLSSGATGEGEDLGSRRGGGTSWKPPGRGNILGAVGEGGVHGVTRKGGARGPPGKEELTRR